MTDRRELDLDGFRQRATGVPPPPPPKPPETPTPPAARLDPPVTPAPAPRASAPPVPARPPKSRQAPAGGGVARMVLNVPWSTSIWAKAVAKGLDLSLADLLSETLTAHTDTVAADLLHHPPVGKRTGSGPYDNFTISADPVLRARLIQAAEELGFVSRSEFVSRLLDHARRIDGQGYRRRLDERTQHLLQTSGDSSSAPAAQA